MSEAEPARARPPRKPGLTWPGVLIFSSGNHCFVMFFGQQVGDTNGDQGDHFYAQAWRFEKNVPAPHRVSFFQNT